MGDSAPLKCTYAVAVARTDLPDDHEIAYAQTPEAAAALVLALLKCGDRRLLAVRTTLVPEIRG